MKFFIVIVSISFSLLSCRGREIVSYDHLLEERDSLERLLYQTRVFCGCTEEDSSVRYYIMGKERDLIDKEIITRVSGISREFKLGYDFSKHHFIEVDKEQFDSVVVFGRYVRLVGCFNPKYYTITGRDSEEYHVLKINEKDKFWKDTPYLVITHN